MHSEIERLFDIKGKKALVTGGARHLGFDAASVLAAAGCEVAITSRDLAQAERSAEELSQKYQVDACGFAMDQTNFESVKRTVDQVAEKLGSVDILVNNAGGTPSANSSNLLERDPGAIEHLINLNLTGMLYVCRQAGALIAAAGGGKIVNVASIAGIVGRDRKIYERNEMRGQAVDYAAAKAGVIGATRDLAAYFAPMGINVNAISPGGFERETMPQGFVEDYSQMTFQKRMGKDGFDLNGAVLFLCSPASDHVTGHNLVVDGGLTIWR